MAQCAATYSATLVLSFFCLTATCLAGTTGTVSGSVGGVVRDTSGTPQVGIVVELLRADSSLVARAFTDSTGSYRFATIFPGQYALKAAGASFIPSLKQNLRVRANTVVNLTLTDLYDLMQLAPAVRSPRARGEDDWAWTLRSAASRPLLRWQDDGTPVLVWDGAQETAKAQRGGRKMQVEASAGGKQFGSGQQHVSMALMRDTSVRRRFAMSAEGDPTGAGMMDAMLGFRQEMANSGLGSSSVQTLAAVMSDPEAGGGARQGLQAASLRTWESLQLVNSLEAEAGSDQVIARLGDGANGSVVMAALPFAGLTLHHGSSSIEYRVATSRSGNSEFAGSDIAPQTWLPILSERDGELVMEHGLHQELGWSTSAGRTEMQLIIFGDSIVNPMIEGSGRLTAGDETGQWMLLDRASGLLRTTGPNYSTTGIVASLESRLPGSNRVKLSYASGDALVMHANSRPEDVAVILSGVSSRRAQMYSIALSGTAEATGTRWRTSYRWQPSDTITRVAPFAVDASEPFLNVYVRQPVWVNRQGPGGLEAQVDLRNLLAEGYQPFLTRDGSHLYFAQAQRGVRGGLAFNF
jgi:hypothetical protein